VETGFKLTVQNYRYLFENASDAMWVQDMKGNIVDANKACEKLTGFTRQKFLGKNVNVFLTGEFLNLAREVHRKLLDGKEIAKPYEQRMVMKDGTVRTMRMATGLVTIDGEPIGFQHIARDITEEKSLGKMLSKITDGFPIPLFMINKQHKVTYWNAAIETLSGISGREMVGTDGQWRTFYTEKRPAMADLIVDGVSADEIEACYQGKCKKSRLLDGAYEAEDFFPSLGECGKWIHFTASPIKDEGGEIIAAIETLQDITEEKRLQENMHFYVQLITRAQEEERRRISRELHDDVSPFLLLLIQRLDTITSSTQLKQPQELKEKLEILRSQAVEALEQLRRCAQDLRPRILDDLGLVAALEWMAENLTKDCGVDAQVKVVGAEPSLTDEVQLLLFRIAQEALTNIRRHAEASRAWITMGFGDDRIVLTVKDNGKGFEIPQRMGDLASIGKLGLAGMQERAQLIQGSLTLKSELRKGTTVTVEIPT